MARQTIPDDQQFAGNVAQQMREKLDDLRAANRSGNSRKWKFHHVTPAIADSDFQLK
jgi:hypothetical protein